jgi:hypothetical protein
MKRHTRNAIAALIAVAGLLATVVPANALGFLLPTRFSAKKIEALAPYVPQSSCQPTAKIGTASLMAYLQKRYPGTGNDGIARACHIGGRSEHKEGRALDWDVNYNNPRQRAQAEDFVNWLLKRDKMGREFANARRLGVMYFIWDGRIWSASEGTWRKYSGASSHRDHIHISLSWAGARGKTSFWTGDVARTVRPFVPGATPTAAPTTSTPTSTNAPQPAVSASPSPSSTASSAVTSGNGSEAIPTQAPKQEDEITWYWERFGK